MKLYHSIMVLSVAIAVWILVQAYGSFVTTSHAPTSRRIDCAHCGVTFKQEAER